MAQENTKPTLTSEEDEIDLIALAKTLWDGRKTIIKAILIFMAIGLFIALFSEKEYTASTTIVPATQGKSIGGSLGGLAAMAGINLGSLGSDSGISTSLYPQIVNSIPFQKQLLQTPITIEGQEKPITYTDYYTNVYNPSLLGYIKKFTIGLPALIIKAIKSKPVIANKVKQSVDGNQIQTVTDDEYQLIKQLKDQLVIDINDKDGYVTISATLPEAKSAAQLAKKAQELLQHYIINFKVQKSKEELKFIQGRYQEKEKEFKTIQNQLASFKDRNQNINTTLAQSKMVQLQSEYDLAFSVYTELAKQLETQQLQVKQDTPVFTVLKPVTIPIEKAKPKRVLILAIWTFLGVIIGIGMVFGKTLLGGLKKDWIKSEN
ncbi:MAG: Wzz/FepE/Etk N-terminal domain-containing protein [Lutibacter sp.]|uniref:Wzz/FepE/Etk N-terminal domain-containing protein n=1 Tax=Lutibacter sp. TaxID=1925666 RepID=UPI00299F48C7|nr:Wzz/FepE/Etk N-terminal domain-containing protein [Lutibacter sp.]MDX1828781.1 Wzz/FepE/Etk N-terminal domain-containing protein [Lutibacter sp.]